MRVLGKVVYCHFCYTVFYVMGMIEKLEIRSQKWKGCGVEPYYTR